MSQIKITRGRPSPSGTDSVNGFATNLQLNSEWVDLKNYSRSSLQLGGCSLRDTTFSSYSCRETGERVFFVFPSNYILAAGATVRVHMGGYSTFFNSTVDEVGADRHVFAGRSWYVLNNRCGDTIHLYNTSGGLVDSAWYRPNPPDGKVLYRKVGTDELAPTTL